jgi:hypothetical protein
MIRLALRLRLDHHAAQRQRNAHRDQTTFHKRTVYSVHPLALCR